MLDGIEERRTSALCLVCGKVVQAGKDLLSCTIVYILIFQITGKRATKKYYSGLTPGECSLHAFSCGAGSGVFFLIEDCKCILVYGPSQIFVPPIYVNSDGETADVRHSTRPLFLSSSRIEQLEKLYFRQQVANEVCQKRSVATHVIRNYYF